jgi:L-aspartate oxidase
VRRSAAAVLEQWFAMDLIVEGGRCVGVRALDPEGVLQEVRASQVVLATGGAGQLYAVTTNPPEATGDGVAMALRAGVAVADLEFFQFHPTALHHPAMPRPLLSEALRGHGALLRDGEGERFVDELAPRDIVSRAMADRMAQQGVGFLWLDATGLESFDERFPTVAASLAAAGLDPAVDWLPIAPAAHYLSGGVVTDLDGASELAGLWAVGEVACTGVHGANRLASNSLLEGMVFGARLAEAVAAGRDGPRPTGVMRALSGAPGQVPAGEIACIEIDTGADTGGVIGTAAATTTGGSTRRGGTPDTRTVREPDTSGGPDADVAKLRERLQRAMIEGAGVLRSPESLAGAAAEVGAVAAQFSAATTTPADTGVGAGRAAGELANLVTVSGALLRGAYVREETRGAHARRDFPEARPQWRCRLVHRAVAPPGTLPPHPRTQS